MALIRLGLREADDGGWQLALARRDAPVAHGHVPPDAVAAVRATVDALPAQADDATWRLLEGEVGRRLGEAIAGSGEPGRTWERLVGRAIGRGRPLVVAIEAEDAIAALPWELLASDAAALEPEGVGAVVRAVSEVPSAREPDPRPARCVVRHLGAAHGTDPIVEAATAAAEARGVAWPLSGPTDDRRVVTLVVHPSGHDFLATLPDGEPELERTLGGAELAWIAPVGADAVPVPVRLADALVRHRCPAVVAADVALDRAAAGAFAAGFFGALFSGEAALPAVVAGRAVLRERELGAAGGRWWRPRLHVGHPIALDLAPFSTRVEATGWPAPSPFAAALLRRARACGEADGFFGVEHLAEATVDVAPREVTTLLPVLRRLLPDWRRRLAALEPQRPESARPLLTPRLVRLAERLRPGFGVVELWGALIAEPFGWGRFLGAEPPEEAPASAVELEVLGGPEDGRRVRLAPGEVLGRASGSRQCDVALYEGLPWTDPCLSRRHLRWLDVGWAAVLVPVRGLHGADGTTVPPTGPVELVAGDLIEVSMATWLVALARAEDDAG